MEEKQEKISDQGIVNSTIWHCDDIKIGHTVSMFKQFTSFSASNKNDVVRLHYGLKGDYLFSYKQLNQSFDLIGGHHNIMWSDGFDMVVQNKTLELETFGIQFPKELFLKFIENSTDSLKRFSENIILGKNTILSQHWGAIDTSVQQVIQQILYNHYSGEMKKSFLISKSLELLVLSALACDVSENKKDRFIKNRTDKEKIIAVRDLINEKAHCPPTLSEIARNVGLNEYKLKRGFKEIFNTTVFGYLTEQRLHLAYQFLRDTQKTAVEISFELGYATPQHFNNAFKQRFGMTPSSIRNNP